jgi:hypothetical protein
MTTVMNPVTDRTPSKIFRVLSTRPSLFGCKGGYRNGLKKTLATMRWPIEKTADIAAGG